MENPVLAAGRREPDDIPGSLAGGRPGSPAGGHPGSPGGGRANRPNWVLSRRPTDRKAVYLYTAWLFVALCFLLVYFVASMHVLRAITPEHPARFGDFFSLWSYGKFIAAHPAIELYDWGLLHSAQVALGMTPTEDAPFPYPPPFIVAFRLLTILPFGWSYVAFATASLLLFARVVAKTIAAKPWSVIAVLFGPISIIAFASGQTGFLAAALLTAGLRLSRSNPVLSGIALGLLSYKPQLGLLVPVGLVAVGAWRAIGATVVTITCLGAAATWRFGWQVWTAWLAIMPHYDAFFVALHQTLPIQPTVLANLRLLGCPYMVAEAVQGAVALVVAVLVWRVHKRGSDRIAQAALIVGTFLATPHAFVYDMPVLIAALCLVVQDWIEAGTDFTVAELAILILATGFPAYMMVARPMIPISSVSLILLFTMIVRRAGRAARRIPAPAEAVCALA